MKGLIDFYWNIRASFEVWKVFGFKMALDYYLTGDYMPLIRKQLEKKEGNK